jgi:hypothetical protein
MWKIAQFHISQENRQDKNIASRALSTFRKCPRPRCKTVWLLSLTGNYPLIPRGVIYHTPNGASRKFSRAGENSRNPLAGNELKKYQIGFGA